MKTIAELLKDLKEQEGSYYAISKKMKIAEASISRIRHGGGCSDETAMKIAELLEIEPAEVLLQAAAERSAENIQGVWLKILSAIKQILLSSHNVYYAAKVNQISEADVLAEDEKPPGSWRKAMTAKEAAQKCRGINAPKENK